MLQQYTISRGPFFGPQINIRLPLNLNYLISSVFCLLFFLSIRANVLKAQKTCLAEKRTLIKHLFRKSNKVVRYTTSQFKINEQHLARLRGYAIFSSQNMDY